MQYLLRKLVLVFWLKKDFVIYCVAWSLTSHQVPTKSPHLSPCINRTGRDNAIKNSWLKITTYTLCTSENWISLLCYLYAVPLYFHCFWSYTVNQTKIFWIKNDLAMINLYFCYCILLENIFSL